MNIKRTGTDCEIYIEGPVGETSPLFRVDVKGLTRLVMDMEKVTYMNSIGVKHWIVWTSQIGPKTQFILRNVPLMIVNQAGAVSGFLPLHCQIESFIAPYVCPKCGTESTTLMKLNQHYRYANAKDPRHIEYPKLTCRKCQTEMEPDFHESKAATFLDRR